MQERLRIWVVKWQALRELCVEQSAAGGERCKFVKNVGGRDNGQEMQPHMWRL